jgi:hypothetical protein
MGDVYWEGSDIRHLGMPVVACADLAARGGAIDFKIGYFDNLDPDGAPLAAGLPAKLWFAEVEWSGTQLSTENHPTAAAAADAMALKLLDGARCRCGKVIVVESESPTATPKQRMWCYWRRHNARWRPGCTAPPIKVSTAGDLDEIDEAMEVRHGPAR